MNTTRAVAKGSLLARLCALLVMAVACWQVQEVPDFEFVDFDDDINIVINPHLGPPDRPLLAWALTDTAYMRRYLPLGWLGLAGVYEYAGLSPRGYHAAGVALHLANAALVFAVLLAGLRRFAAEVDDTWRAAGATLGALLWAVHPFRAETVGWASGLLYEQSGSFALLSLLAYLRVGLHDGTRRTCWLAVSALLYTASMLAYPMSLGLAGVFVAIDWLEIRRGGRQSPTRWGLEKLWLVVPALAVLGVTYWARMTASGFWEPAPSWQDFGWAARWRQVGLVWVYYLVKPWWPLGLTPVCTWLMAAESRLFLGWFCLGVAGGVSVALIVRGRRWPVLAALWFAHVALLAPMLGFNERPHFPADRYHYLAGVVWVGAVVAGLTALSGWKRIAALSAGLVAVLVLAGWQRQQLSIWRNTDALMGRIVAAAQVPVVRDDFARRWVRHHANRGDQAQAQAVATSTRVALPPRAETMPEGWPAMASAHLRLALDFARAGRARSAREHFQLALRYAPRWPEAMYRAAIFFLEEGELDEAWRWCRRLEAGGQASGPPLAVRQRLLGALAEAFHASGKPGVARGLLRRALREAQSSADGPGVVAELQAQLARYTEPAQTGR